MKPKVVVKQQSELNSKQWGIYVNGKLVDGGFFAKDAALKASREFAQFVCPR